MSLRHRLLRLEHQIGPEVLTDPDAAARRLLAKMVEYVDRARGTVAPPIEQQSRAERIARAALVEAGDDQVLLIAALPRGLTVFARQVAREAFNA